MQNVPRLIQKFKPKNYKLSLEINRKKRTFDGEVVIFGSLVPGSDSIQLHSKDLFIDSVLIDDTKASFKTGKDNILEIKIDKNNYNLHKISIKYSGIITDSMNGMYPCYFEHNGQKKELIATQFESHYAREVFPCIDEPEAKATFDVQLKTEQNVTVLGNMPIKNQHKEGDALVTSFETTPVMSTYLVAWVIGEMHKKTAYTRDGVQVNVWATPAQPADNLDFALDIAKRSIEFFDEYFGIPYPLKKCDHVALPDFAAGAMENWGLVTYREIALLVDPKTSSVSSQHYVATVIAHELSHQWFGNLVTMKWWNNLWLNESFATFIEYVAVNALQPDWNVWLDFISFDGVIALKRDCLCGVQPVQVDVHHPDEISTLFDGAIVYAKGARLIQMLFNYIGEEAFKNGLKNYFQKHAYKNTESDDLWKAFSDSSGKDIAGFMNAWICQPGFPVLNITENTKTISLTQNRLSSNKTADNDSIWPIPINSNHPDAPNILDKKSLTFEKQTSEPYLFNVGNRAHYIVNYPAETLDYALNNVRNKATNPADRLQLLNSQTILANLGIVSNAELITVLDAYRDEDVEAVWTLISVAIGELKKFVEHDSIYDKKLRQFTGQIARKQYEKLGWQSIEGEADSNSKLRAIIIGLMVYSEDINVISNAVKIFDSIPVNEITPELRALIISAVVKYEHNDKTVNSLFKLYADTDCSELKHDISMGITSTQDSKTINRILESIKDLDFIKQQDSMRWIVHLLRNRVSRETTWRWIRDNWKWIKKVFGNDKSYDDFPRYIANFLSKKEQLEEYIKFFKPLSADPILTRAVDIGTNEIRNRIDNIDRDRDAVLEKLKNL